MTLRDNLILLLAAALVTGLLVPFVSSRMNERRAVQRRQAEEALARDSKFIAAQADFLDRLSTDLWRVAGRLLAVSYYATQSSEQFTEAWRRYEEVSFDELFGLRAHVSQAQRMVSDSGSKQLSDLHAWIIRELDPALTTKARSMSAEASPGDWSTFHTTTTGQLFTLIDDVLHTIAIDVGVIHR